MTELFVSIYHFFRDHRVVCWASMIGLFALFGFFASQIYLEEDINKLMPSSKNEDGSTKLAFADLRIKDKTFLLFSKNPDCQEKLENAELVEELAATCDAFVDSLMACDTTAIEDVFYRLPDDLLFDAVDYFSSHLPAYIDTALYAGIDTLLTPEHMARQMLQNRDDLDSELGEAMPELIQMDPLGIRTLLKNRVSPSPEQTDTAANATVASGYSIVSDHFFVPDSSVCVAFITPRFSSTNTGQGSALFVTLNQLIEQFKSSHPNVTISYHGTPASGYYNSTTIKHDLTTTIIGSLVLVLLFILLCFREWDTLPLLLLPVAFGTLFGLAVMYWLKGQFSLLALGIGAIVLGVALSYVLHILTHFKYVASAEQVLRDQTKPVLLGCITTIGSFIGLLFIQTDLLQDFGLFAALAIVGTVFFSLVYLPQLKSTSATRRPLPAFIDKLNSYPFDRNRPLIVVLMVATAVCVGFYLVGGTQFDADMHNLGYEAPNTTFSEKLLEQKTHTGDKTKYFASSGKSMEEAIERFDLLGQKLDSLQRLGLVKSFTPTNQIFVSLKRQQQRIDAWQRYWTQDRLAVARRLIAQTAPQAGLRADAFEPFFELATAQYEPDALYEAGIIPAGFQSTLMEQSYGGDYLCFTSVRCENDTVRSSQSDYMRICDAVASIPGLLVLDTYYYTTDTLNQLNADFNVLQWVSMAFVFFVLLLSFRFGWKPALLAFSPILLSWIVVLGAMVIFDVKFNLINIIISTFIFGIGVDYSIFVMTGLLSGGGSQLSYHKTAIFFSAVILIVTVGSMLVAIHPAIRSVGFATLVGMMSAVVLSYVLQPAAWRMLNHSEKTKSRDSEIPKSRKPGITE